MTITLNGESHELVKQPAYTVQQLVDELELGPQPVLVELDGEALYAREFADREITDGSVVEIVRMVAGG